MVFGGVFCIHFISNQKSWHQNRIKTALTLLHVQISECQRCLPSLLLKRPILYLAHNQIDGVFAIFPVDSHCIIKNMKSPSRCHLSFLCASQYIQRSRIRHVTVWTRGPVADYIWMWGNPSTFRVSAAPSHTHTCTHKNPPMRAPTAGSTTANPNQ